MSDMDERWLPVPGYEGYYEVSDQGRVRSLDRWVQTVDGRRVFYRGTIRAQSSMTTPSRPWAKYTYVKLSRDGKKTPWSTHRLVLTAFVGPCPDGMEACHNNGDGADDRLVNLRWDTRTENFADRRRHKTHCKRGHEFTPENTRLDPRHQGLGRQCRECDRILGPERARRNRAKAKAANA